MNEFLKNFIQKLRENLNRQEKILKHIENDLKTEPEIWMAIHSYLNKNIHLTDTSCQFIHDLEKKWETEIKKS